MSLKDTKKNVFTKIGAYTSLNEQGKMPDTTSIYPSVNNSKETIPFLMDVMGTILGADAMKSVTGEVFTKFLDGVEPKLKESLKKQVTGINADDPLPTDFVNNGIEIGTGDMDSFSKLKAINTPTEDYLFDNTKPTFDNIAADAIKSPNTEKTFGGILKISHDPSTDKMKIKPLNAGLTIGAFLIGFIDSMVIINKKETTTKVMDLIYGTVSSTNNKSVNQLKSELSIRKAIDQYINEDDDSFVVNPKYNDEILKTANELSKGITTHDMGCGLITVSLALSDLSELVSIVSGSTDPFVVGNAFEATITASASNSNNSVISKENEQTIKDGFFKKLINMLTATLTESVTTSPQVRALMSIYTTFSNNGTSIINNAEDDIKYYSNFIKCNVNVLTELLIQFIMTLAIAALNKLLIPIIKKIIREKTNQYVNTLKSLSPVKIPDVGITN